MKRQNGRLTEQRMANIWPGWRHCFHENFQCPADLIIHNYQSDQSTLMTRCRTDLPHQYGIWCNESQMSFSRNNETPLELGAKEDGCFRRLRLKCSAWIWMSAVIMIGLCKELSVSPDVNGGSQKPNFAVHRT